MASHGITSGALPEIVLVVFADARGMQCRVQATDDRGTAYDVLVSRAG